MDDDGPSNNFLICISMLCLLLLIIFLRQSLPLLLSSFLLRPSSFKLFLVPFLVPNRKMQLPVEIALLAAAACIIYLVVSQIIISRQNAANARKLGCKEPPIQRNRYPLGIDNLLRAIAADKAKLFPVDAIQRTIDNGAITYKYTLLGSTNYFTADEKNIQAMLATNFSDWDVSNCSGLLLFEPISPSMERAHFYFNSCYTFAQT
jgi:hypothetical protein